MSISVSPEQSFDARFARALRARGVAVEKVNEAAAEAVGALPSTGLTDAEMKFAVAAGVPERAFTEEGRQEARQYRALHMLADRAARGPRYTTNEVAKRLGKDPSNVRRMLKHGDLFAAGREGTQTTYPAWQFTEVGVLPHLREVIAAFPPGYHAGDIEAIMTSPMDELNGRSPKEWLAADGSAAVLVSLLDELALA